MSNYDKLKEICAKAMKRKGLDSKAHIERCRLELKEIEAQNEEDYFIDLYERGVKYDQNENNLLIPHLLGIVDDFDLESDPTYSYGDFPDIDIDYIPEVRDYIKNEWVPQRFGKEYVANIGSYNTFGIKGALIDMARVHGKDRNEILNITTKLGLKDDEGKALTWDKAMEMYKPLKEYCDKNPDVALAAKKMLYRNRSMGKHAGGLIISNKALADFVPLIKAKGLIQTAWTEGLHDQDLGPVGLVKIDNLVITNLVQIAYACHLIKQRHNIPSVCALPGQEDFSDISFLEDKDALTMADKADLRCIFQFDSEGIRNLVKKGGVDRFEDLVAYASLFRPGPMESKADESYCNRKRGKEEYELHPVLEPILGDTYGVICIHQNALISFADGREITLALVKRGDVLHSVNLETKRIESKECHGCMPTRKCDGILLELENGLSTILTPDHEVLTFEGMKKAENLDLEIDLIACPRALPKIGEYDDLASYLGTDAEVAYLIGQFVGDGCLSSTNTTICSGEYSNHLLLRNWLKRTFKDIIEVGDYFHCRSWYITLSGRDLVCNTSWFGNRKKKLSAFIDEMGLRVTSRNKNVPAAVIKGTSEIRRAFLAGLFDSDGCLVQKKTGEQIAFITSSSDLVLNSVRKLLLFDGVLSSIHQDRIYVSDTQKLKDLIEPYLVVKKFTGKLSQGEHGWLPRKLLFEAAEKSGLSIRKFCSFAGLDRQHFRKKTRKNPNFIRDKFAKAIGVSVGDLIYYKIKKKVVLPNQQFYGISVADNHNLIADGIFVKNCYQEQCMKILNVVGGVPLKDCEILRKAISKKKEEYFESYKVMFIENGQKILGWSEEEVLKLWDQLAAFSAYAFNLSHAVAYTYISFMLLWLKAHYALEFYAAVFRFENIAEKLKEYKVDAERHDINIKKPHIDKSGVRFEIVDNELYFGLANIKGIGDAAAEKIVENQPYGDSFIKFLAKYGTDSNTIKPLIGLRVWDGDPVELYKIAEIVKTEKNKRESRDKRYATTFEKARIAVSELISREIEDHREILNLDFDFWECTLSEEDFGKLQDLYKKYDRSLANYEAKVERDGPLENFNFNEYPQVVEIDDKLKTIYESVEESERQFYGFLWTHPLEKSPDYKGGMTFQDVRESDKQIVKVEVMVVSRTETVSRNKKITYWLLRVEDAYGENVPVQVWEDDWERFSDRLAPGNLVILELKVPDHGWARYTLNSPQKWERARKLRSKENDFRVVVLRKEGEDEGCDPEVD